MLEYRYFKYLAVFKNISFYYHFKGFFSLYMYDFCLYVAICFYFYINAVKG